MSQFLLQSCDMSFLLYKEESLAPSLLQSTLAACCSCVVAWLGGWSVEVLGTAGLGFVTSILFPYC
ncbi:hypothetical protein L873DRAFT_91231 [Choiromyces venosus 120613-1]|uniref:Uncharacterized protein n=1 Tax=Choiromyces venosus 120613-1 TaxID=1336337 RepID=A0A3N4K5J0_9PEZI|nr:hypothetical protein L873DRAFT_91231 [Choiromyces venosus 120613-1]